MKRLLCLLLCCLLPLSVRAVAEPALTPAPLTGDWAGWASGGGALVENIPTPIHFSIMSKDGRNVLLVLRLRDAVWQTDIVARSALRDGWPPPSVTPDADGECFTLLYYDEGDAYESYTFTADDLGRFSFCFYAAKRADGTGLTIDYAKPGTLRYSETAADGRLTMTTLPDAAFALGLEAFDANAFPVTLAEAVALGAPSPDAVVSALVREDAGLGDNAYQIPDQTMLDAPGGKPVAWVFAGAEAEVLENGEDGWARVRVGTLEGWLPSEALALGAARQQVRRRPPVGMARESYYAAGQPFIGGLAVGSAVGLYAAPDEDSTVLSTHCTEVGDLMRVLAILPSGWLQAVNSLGQTGYIRSLWVTQCADPWVDWPTARAVAVVLNPDPADRLNLRAYPDVKADSYGKFYSGTFALPLFDIQRYDGWRYVRIGDQDGYMMEEYLRYPANADVGFLPPTATVRAETRLRRQPDASAELTPEAPLPEGATVHVLGVRDDAWYFVQAYPDVAGWDGLQGWLPADRISAVGPSVPGHRPEP